MKALSTVLTAVALAASAAAANAADFHFTGNITYNTDVIRVAFHLDNPTTGVKVWTDSFQSGVNFDPITAIWDVSNGAVLLGQDDDNDSVGPGQTYYDSGFVLGALGAGDYLFTIAAYPNFANGNLLTDGFRLDGTAPIAIGDWCQPASNNCTNQKGTYFSVWLSGVDAATPPPTAVPEPETYALMLAGLGVTAWMARRRKAA
jgi:PEP-CTERM motif